MFTLNDLLDQVECQGKSKVLVIKEGDGEVEEVFSGDYLTDVPYKYGSMELAYIYNNENGYTCYEVRE